MRLASIILVVLGLGCSKKSEVQLPGGSKAVVAGASFGTNHTAQGAFSRKLGEFAISHLTPSQWKYLPEALLPVGVTQSTQPQLVVFLKHAVRPETQWGESIVNSPHSTFMVGHSEGLFGYFDAFSRTHYTALHIQVFPRRHKELSFELHPLGGGGRLPILISGIPNPVQTNAPFWKPDTLPVSRTQEGVTVTLSDVEAVDIQRSYPRLPGMPPTGPMERRTQVKALVENARHQPVRVFAHRLSDPGGNALFEGVGTYYREDISYLKGSLFDDEPAWRLDVETERTSSGPSPDDPDEFYVLSDLLDMNDRLVTQAPPFHPSKRFPELSLTLIHFSGGSSPGISLWLDNRPDGVRVELAEARDQTGRLWSPRLVGPVDRGTGIGISTVNREGFTYFIDSNEPYISKRPEMTSITATFRVFRTLTFTFHPAAKFRALPNLVELPVAH